MSDPENPKGDGSPDHHERFEEISPSGHVRTRRRKHSGPYNAPIPEAADLNAMRIDWRTGRPAVENPAPGSAAAPDQAKLNELVRRVANELGMEAPAQIEESARANAVTRGDHPADRLPPPLPASLAVLNQKGIFHESTGKRRRKREHGEHGSGGRRHCPFCQHNRAQHIHPTNPFARLLSLVGIRTYSCRNCHKQFMAFAFVEGPYFTWRQVGIAALIFGLMVLGYLFISPLFNRIPDLPE
jgi:hypothetical protein